MNDALFRLRVRHKAHSSIVHRVNDVVALENGLAKDEKFVLVWRYREHADRHVTILRNVNYVILRLKFQPIVSKHPRKRNMCSSVACNKRDALVKLVFWVTVSNNKGLDKSSEYRWRNNNM